MFLLRSFSFFFFNDTATTEIYTLSLHDALPIYQRPVPLPPRKKPISQRISAAISTYQRTCRAKPPPDRKSTRLNSSHGYISYAVFCLKKKKKKTKQHSQRIIPHV